MITPAGASQVVNAMRVQANTPYNDKVNIFNLLNAPSYNSYADLAACAYPKSTEFHKYSPPEGFTFVQDFDDLRDAGFTAQIYTHLSGIKVLAIAGTEGFTREKDSPIQNLITIMKDVMADMDFMMEKNMEQVTSATQVFEGQDQQAIQVQNNINRLVDKCNIAVSNGISQTSKKMTNCAERIVGDVQAFNTQINSRADQGIDVIVGHSLGGIVGKIIAYKMMLRQQMAANIMGTPEHKRRKLACVTFNSPDVSQFVGVSIEPINPLPLLRVENICHPWDMIAAALSSPTLGQMRIGDTFNIIMRQLGYTGRLSDGKTQVISEAALRNTKVYDAEKELDLFIINSVNKMAQKVYDNIEVNNDSFFGSDNSDLNMYGMCQVLDLKIQNLRDHPTPVALFGLVNYFTTCKLSERQRVNLKIVIEILGLKFELCHSMAVMQELIKAESHLGNSIPLMHKPGF